MRPTLFWWPPYGAVPRGGRWASTPRAPGGTGAPKYFPLRRVRTLALPAKPAPQVVGIDDWAWRKGHRYGTIVVALERGCPIDLLEDRAAETVATWLQAHPDIKIVARDRSSSFGRLAVLQGAPEAPQVAD